MDSHCRAVLSSIVLLVVISVATASPPTRLPEGDAISASKTEIQKEVREERFSGAVLIAKAGTPVFQAAYGYANREKKIPNTLDTKFRFGSMGKMFTAVAVLQLVQAGKIKLDDPIGKYLRDYPNKEVGAVTIHQLLTHTGGTGDIFTPEYFEKRAEIQEHSDYVKLYGNRGLQFTPGAKWEYSNYGFVLLGRIIEVVSGQTYFDYVREHIFKPAGMDSTDNLPEDQNVADLSVGYTRQGEPHVMQGRPQTYSRGAPAAGGPPHIMLKGPGPSTGPGSPDQEPSGPMRTSSGILPYRGTSAGGGYSTVGDLLKFVNALNGHKLLDEHYSDLLITGKVETPRPGTKYAYGFEDHITPDGVRFFGHGGGGPGMNGRLSVFPKSGYVVVVLSNFDPPAGDNLAKFIGDLLPAN